MRHASRALSLILAVVFISGLAPTYASENDDTAVRSAERATADDFAWLAGAWRGTGLGGDCEEVWSRPMAGTMVGTFRLVRDGKTAFYELILLEADDRGFAMKLKHFNGDFTAWEEGADHVRFDLVEVAPGRATFEGLTIERNGDSLTIRVRLQREGEEARWEPFDFERVELAGP